MKKKIITSIVLIFLAFFIFKTISFIPHTKSRRNKSGPPPTTYNLGINFDDFLFIDSQLNFYNNKIFLENGDVLTGPGGPQIMPHPMYVLPPGIEVLSVTNGKVADIKYQAESNDYSLVIYPDESAWTIDYDHVTDIKVKKGDSVTAGQVIAHSPLATGYLGQYNLGFFEIMIFEDTDSHENNLTVCLYNLLDDSVKSGLHDTIYQFVASWEKFKGDATIYDEQSWQSPGCIVNQIKEGDTRL